ncbi:sensor histidine kinase [Gorillibacterium timonense]|uniref:sensor histidine kinase n=1 Tax=Gorillibacterium timonense TaxID=1689269 RepID=UPI00071DDFC1|nr:HAMP domain-containing sensor histidine kinase [Gorillibacterium timonense]
MILAISIALLAAALCAFVSWFSYRYVKRSFDAMDRILDGVLARHADFSMETTRDNRLSKLTHKAIKIIQMSTIDVKQTKQEKETIQSFLSDMSHQMKTPLSGISMYTDLLLEGNTTADEQQEFLTRIKAGTEKLQWMMVSLVKMSRLEVGAIELVPVSASIKPTLSQSISDVYMAASKKNITIHTEPFEDVLLLHDRKWTGEALANLLENAVKYAPAGSVIQLSVEAMPIYTKINITDYGPGIDPDEWNAVFKRFYRGRNAEGVEGAGLGLFLAAMIVQKQGGYILVDSKPGRYTTFSLFLQNGKK